MNENHAVAQGAAGPLVWPTGAPLYQYAARQHLDEVRALTADWEPHRDVHPVFDLVARAKALGFKLVKA